MNKCFLNHLIQAKNQLLDMNPTLNGIIALYNTGHLFVGALLWSYELTWLLMVNN